MDNNVRMTTVSSFFNNLSTTTSFTFNTSNNESLHNSTTEPTVTKDDSAHEIRRMMSLITYPILIIFGTFGNLLSFYVMRKGSLKEVSTCFYMSILALTDTGKYKYLWIERGGTNYNFTYS